MGTFLFLLLFFFVLLPLGRVAWAVWRQYRLVKRHMRQAEEFGERFRAAQGGARGQQRPPAGKKKKIASDVGEYVAFEEMRVYTDAEAGTTGAEAPEGSAEPQVEDADWEEIH